MANESNKVFKVTQVSKLRLYGQVSNQREGSPQVTQEAKLKLHGQVKKQTEDTPKYNSMPLTSKSKQVLKFSTRLHGQVRQTEIARKSFSINKQDPPRSQMIDCVATLS